MISFNFNIKNPWNHRFQNIKTWYGSTFIPNKNWEIEIYKCTDIIGFNFNFNIHQDHAGLSTSISFFGHGLGFHVYDSRHWNHDEDCWY